MEHSIEKELKLDLLEVNVGPQHPSTHGVLRLKTVLDGERVHDMTPVIGYLHRGKEKLAESRTYFNYLPMVDRVDYLSSVFCLCAYCYAVEDLAKINVPKRAEYLRLIAMELNRIASHCMFVGSFLLDLGATSPLFYTFRERERILQLLEELTGARMMYHFFRFGGLKADAPPGWLEKVKQFCLELPKYIDEYEAIIAKNPIVLSRTVDQGLITPEFAISYGLSGPNLRASGIKVDLRKTNPYSVYREIPFNVALGIKGDSYERYKVRILEMYESAKIILSAIENIPGGDTGNLKLEREKCGCKKDDCPVCGFDTKYVGQNINTLNFKPPEGEVFTIIESPRGMLGCYIVSDGSTKPYRCKWRTGSFSAVQSLPILMKGHLYPDLMPIFGSLDVILPEVDR